MGARGQINGATEPLLSGERLQTDGSPAKLNPQTNSLWSAEYSKRYANVLQMFEVGISENFCISISFGNYDNLSIHGLGWS